MDGTIKFLVGRIEALTNEHNLLYPVATANYILLAEKFAQRLRDTGRLQAADAIRRAIARFYAITKI